MALFGHIVGRIETLDRRRARRSFAFFTVLGIASFTAIVPSVLYLVTSFQQSGFSRYVSLIFTDSATALSLWKDLSLALVDSIPLVGTTILLASVFALLVSVRYVFRDLRVIRLSTGSI